MAKRSKLSKSQNTIILIPYILVGITILLFIFTPHVVNTYNKWEREIDIKKSKEAWKEYNKNYQDSLSKFGFIIDYPNGWQASQQDFTETTNDFPALKSFHVYSNGPIIPKGKPVWVAFTVFIYPPHKTLDDWFPNYIKRLNNPVQTGANRNDFSVTNTLVGNKSAYYINHNVKNPFYNSIYVILGEKYTYEIQLAYPPTSAEIVRKYLFPHITFQD